MMSKITLPLISISLWIGAMEPERQNYFSFLGDSEELFLPCIGQKMMLKHK